MDVWVARLTSGLIGDDVEKKHNRNQEIIRIKVTTQLGHARHLSQVRSSASWETSSCPGANSRGYMFGLANQMFYMALQVSELLRSGALAAAVS